MNIPEGYVLVPVELTQEMIQAGIDTECVETGDEVFDEKQDYRAVYKSFLESAPQFPEYDEAKERDLFGKFYCEYYGVGGSVSIKDGLNIWLACAKSSARSAE